MRAEGEAVRLVGMRNAAIDGRASSNKQAARRDAKLQVAAWLLAAQPVAQREGKVVLRVLSEGRGVAGERQLELNNRGQGGHREDTDGEGRERRQHGPWRSGREGGAGKREKEEA